MKFSERVSNIQCFYVKYSLGVLKILVQVILCLRVKLKIYNPQNNWLSKLSILCLGSGNNSNYVTVYEYVYVWCVMHTTESCTVCAGTVYGMYIIYMIDISGCWYSCTKLYIIFIRYVYVICMKSIIDVMNISQALCYDYE